MKIIKLMENCVDNLTTKLLTSNKRKIVINILIIFFLLCITVIIYENISTYNASHLIAIDPGINKLKQRSYFCDSINTTTLNDYYYKNKTYPKDYTLYNLNVVCVDSCGIDLKSLFKEIVKKGNLRVDTISEIKTVYFLKVKDIEKIKINNNDPRNKDYINLDQLQNIISRFAESQNIIIRVPEELKDIMIKDDIAFFRKNMKPLVKLPEALKNVEKKYGFVLTPKHAEVKTIRIFEK
mgnify:CR=1 FL=1